MMLRAAVPVLALAVAALAGALLPDTARAQIYRWTDDDGTIHYSQGLETVPQRFRAAAAIIGYDRPAPPAAPPAPAAGTGTARIRFTPGEPIMVTARINGGARADLMLDTGAARTVIHPRVLESVGVSYRDARRGSLRGVTGEADVLAVTVDTIDVEGAAHGPLLVVSHDAGFRGDGLLGRDFLDHFSVLIDNAAGLVTLTPK
jgi:predicted aspartyl protease